MAQIAARVWAVPGSAQGNLQAQPNFPFDPASVDAVILSHAHIDHSGNLPNLVKQGFSGSIYATPATIDLAEIMLRDSGHIQESDAAYLNYRQELRGADLIEPLYTQEDAEAVRPLMKAMNWASISNPFPV
jgi:metallo-beta-lactamase family protein